MKLLFGIEDKGDGALAFVRHKNKHGHFIHTSISWVYFEHQWIAWGYMWHKLKYDKLARRLKIEWYAS